ncbi:MAG: hypothetical protein WD407_11790 [Rhodospirillales bacterium]
MTTVNRQSLIIPYGTNRWDENVFSTTGGGHEVLTFECRTRFVVIDPARHAPYRLNGGRYEFPSPPNLRLLPTVWDQLGYLEEHFLGLCGTWAKYQQLFVTRYFDFIRARVEEEKEPLSARIASFGDLYEYRDWAFSALRPFPQAYLHAPKVPGGEALPTAGDFVAVDIAFWTGREIVVIDLGNPETADPFQRRRMERIRDAGIAVTSIAPAVLDGGDMMHLRDALPVSFSNFWEGELAPARPFVDTKLEDIDPGDIGF